MGAPGGAGPSDDDADDRIELSDDGRREGERSVDRG
jgi:hypothetical protein